MSRAPSGAIAVPVGRRAVLRVGAAAVGLGVPGLLAACRDDDGQVADEAVVAVGAADQARLRTATSVELLLVEAYDRIAGRPRPDLGAPARQLFARLADHHGEHVESLRAAAVAAGGAAHDTANATLRDRLLLPGLEAATTRVAVLGLARDLEQFAAATDVLHAVALDTPELRRGVLAIGGAEARHAAAIRGLLAGAPAPDAFLDTAPALPDDYSLD